MSFYVFVFNGLLALYCFASWHVSKNREDLWLALINATMVLIGVWDYLARIVLPLSDPMKMLSSTVVHYSWLVVLALVAVVAIRKVRRK
jgi:hypothetical protein